MTTPHAHDAWDVVVIGAGPAGTSAAISSARAGARTLLVDKAPREREKVCGCCLSAQGVQVLHELESSRELARSVCEHALPLTHAHVHARGKHARFALPQHASAGLAVSRRTLDSALASAAERAGASLRFGTPAKVLHAGDEQSLALVRLGDDRSASQVHARAIIVADGLQGGSLPALPSLEQRIARRAMIGIGTHIDASSLRDAGLCPPMQGHIAMHVGSVGYVGLVALPQGTIDLACALQASAHTMPRPAQVARVLSQALSLAQHSEASLLALFSQARWRGAPALHRSREPALGRTLLAGDAFAYVEPFSGEGMTWALLAGRLAGQLAGQLADQLADQRKESVALSPHAASTPSRGESPASPHANTSAASLAFVYRAQLRALLRARHARCRVLASVASAPWLVAGACAATRFAPAVGKLLGRTLASSWHAPLRSLA